jgi:hypothetical protein
MSGERDKRGANRRRNQQQRNKRDREGDIHHWARKLHLLLPPRHMRRALIRRRSQIADLDMEFVHLALRIARRICVVAI